MLLELRRLEVPPGQRLLLRDVTWEEFETIVEELGDHRGARLAYADGVLEIMTPLPEHEGNKEIISDLVKALPARIIHQPVKLANDKTCGVKMSPTSTVSQGHHAPQTTSSGHPGVRHIGLQGAIRRTASWQPSEAANHCFAIGAGLRFQFAEPCSVKRRPANKVKLRLNIGATGHDEGSDILLRSVHSWTRAPSLNNRTWSVSMVALAHEVVWNTSRRKGSSQT